MFNIIVTYFGRCEEQWKINNKMNEGKVPIFIATHNLTIMMKIYEKLIK
jgi:hypothetical protein